jgi:hypothetical protein
MIPEMLFTFIALLLSDGLLSLPRHLEQLDHPLPERQQRMTLEQLERVESVLGLNEAVAHASFVLPTKLSGPGALDKPQP